MVKTVAEIETRKENPSACKVALLEAEDVDMVWDETYPFIKKALRHAEGELQPEDIKKHLDSGDLRLWVALKDKEINVKQQDLAAKQQQGQQKINLEKVKIGKKEESDKAKIESNEDIAELRGRIAREKLKQTAKSSGPTQKSSGQKK